MLKSKYLQSILLAVFSIAFTQLFIQPIFTSDDDIFYLLTLSGGFGESPSNLLSTLHIWHPIYGWLIKSLFQCCPEINWYTLFLQCFHLVGLSAVYFYLQARHKTHFALILYFLLFIIFEIRLLQNPDFTGSVLIATIGGCLLLILGTERAKYLYAGSLVLLCSFLLRFHISALVVFLFTPLLFFPLFKKAKKVMMSLLIVIFCWMAFHFGQIQFYKQNISAWASRSNFRETFFFLANHPISIEKQEILKGKAEQELFQKRFIYDTAKFNTIVLSEIGRQAYKPRNPLTSLGYNGFYWAFINNRIYLSLLFCISLIVFLFKREVFFKRIIYVLLPLAIYLYLSIFLKVTFAIYMAFFLSIFFYLIDADTIFDFEKKSKRYGWILIAGLCFWSGKLIYENHKNNIRHRSSFQCLVDVLQKNSNRIFVAGSNEVALNGMPAWNTPSNYKFDNLVYYQHLLTGSYENILKRRGVSDPFPTWLFHQKIRLIGEMPTLLSEYCYKNYGLNIVFVQDDLADCVKTYKGVYLGKRQ